MENVDKLNQILIDVAVMKEKVDSLAKVMVTFGDKVEARFEKQEKQFIELSRADRKEQFEALEKKDAIFMQLLEKTKKDIDDKYGMLIPMHYKLMMLLGALVLLGWLGFDKIKDVLTTPKVGIQQNIPAPPQTVTPSFEKKSPK